jgi:Tol biopolymer transport system component
VAAEVDDLNGGLPRSIGMLEAKSGGTTKIWEPPISVDSLGVPRCSPDGTEIAYSVNKGGSWLYFYIHTIDSKSEKYYQKMNGVTGYASWSKLKDFAFMTYDNGFNILLTSSYGSPIDAMPKVTESGDKIEDAKHPALSPDGRKLAFHCLINGSRYICLSDIGSHTATELQHVEQSEVNGVKMDSSVMWSGDGKWLYFSSSKDGDWDIYRMKPDGSGLHNLTQNWSSNEFMPSLRW